MYTKYFLEKRGVKLYKFSNGNSFEILNKIKSTEYPPQETQIVLGQHLISEEEYDIKQIDLNQLKEFNICVAQEMRQVVSYKPPKLIYYLAYTKSHPNEVIILPKTHVIQFNSFFRSVRLIGPNVENQKTDWMMIDKKEEREREKTNKEIMSIANKEISNLYPNGFLKTKKQVIKIKEAAIGVSSYGELVCFEDSLDIPMIGAAGMTGAGKSFLNHRLKDVFIEKGNIGVIEINDRKTETVTHYQTWDEKTKFSRNVLTELEKINEFTKPMPMIYFPPISETLKAHHKILDGELGFDVSIPFKELMKDLRDFEGFYNLGKSTQYLSNITRDKEGVLIENDGFLGCKTLGELTDFVDSKTKFKNVTDPEAIIPVPSNGSIKNFLRSVWKTNILDISNKESPYSKIKFSDGIEHKNYPWITALIAGLSVSIPTKHIIKQDYYHILLKFLIENIFDQKSNNPMLKDLKIMIFGDEITDLMKLRRAFELIYEISRVGRGLGVGLFLSTQYYEEIPPQVRTNLSHFFIFQQKRNDPKMEKDFFKKYPKIYEDTFKLKKRECVACGEFVLYHPITGKRYKNNGVPIKMKLLPPNSLHQPPPNGK